MTLCPVFVEEGRKQHGTSDITEAFILLANNTDHISFHCQSLLERFVVLLYDRTSSLTEVNEARV